MNDIRRFIESESEEHPKMLEVYVQDRAWQQAFCFALSITEPDESWEKPKLLMTIIGGPDSTMQAMKAAIDSGYHIHAGKGIKNHSGYSIERELEIATEKGKYITFAMAVGNRKAMAIVHQDIDQKDIMVSFGDYEEDVRRLLGNRYGLPTLPEWKGVLYRELLEQDFLVTYPLYYDANLFEEGMQLFSCNMDEYQADQLIKELVQSNKLSFPKKGNGRKLEKIESLMDYMQAYSEKMIEKLSSDIEPTHNPLKDWTLARFTNYETKLFPVQEQVSTAIAKRLRNQPAVILQGEMSTGKSKMMIAISDGYNYLKGREGYFSIIIVPPSLTEKWAEEEIYDLLPKPRSKVILINKTSELIEYHQKWIEAGRPKPNVPTFFILSFNTLRGDASIEPIVRFEEKKTIRQREEDDPAYRYGYYCPDCGHPLQVITGQDSEIDGDGNEVIVNKKTMMVPGQFEGGRRIKNSLNPMNAYCVTCSEDHLKLDRLEDEEHVHRVSKRKRYTSLWTRRVPTRYRSFKEWAKNERNWVEAAKSGDKAQLNQLREAQPEIPKIKGKPRRVSAIEYIRRKMKGFFSVAIVDEVHMLKGGATAQGNALGSLAAVCEKVIAGTGTLFGGRADDIYYILWRLFPYLMVQNGFQYSEVSKWNHEYGNIETTTYESGTVETEYTNTQSRGGTKRTTQKVLPGISPFVFGKFLVQNSVLVRLLDVWPDPVDLVDVPTIMVDPTKEMMQAYSEMKNTFDKKIQMRKDGWKLWLLYTDTGIAYPDNMFTYPQVFYKNQDNKRELIWSPVYLSENTILPKEEKLQELVKGEISEGRASIVYVRDTGTSNPGRNIMPRLEYVLSQVEGVKVVSLRAETTHTAKRSKWLRKKVEEGYNVIIVSMELVKVGLDLLCTPTLIFYQFNWSLFTLAQAAKRAWRIGQTKECRLYYLAYRHTFQEDMAKLIAMKQKAAQAINGDVSSDGLSAMLGDEGDLQSMLIDSVKKGSQLKGSTEEWVAEASDRARELLAQVGKKREVKPEDQLIQWVEKMISTPATKNLLAKYAEEITKRIQCGEVNGFSIEDNKLHVDLISAFGMDLVSDGDILAHLYQDGSERSKQPKIITPSISVVKNPKKRSKVADGQLAFNLFD